MYPSKSRVFFIDINTGTKTTDCTISKVLLLHWQYVLNHQELKQKQGWHFLWKIFEENGRNFLVSALWMVYKILDGIHLGNELNNPLHYIKDYMNFIENYRQQYTSNFLAFSEGEREWK